MTQIDRFFCPTRVSMGLGAHAEVTSHLRGLGAERVLVLLDGALEKTPFWAAIRGILDADAVAFQVFTEIEPDPSADTVLKAAAAAARIDAQALLAIGGGSTMDVGKAVGILATNGGRIHDYEGIDKFAKPPLRMVAIPSTAGTGSEVSGSCVITDTEKGLKMSIRSAALNPAAVAILDPLALETVPAHVAAHSGMDAFVHAFESYISRNANSITDALNLQAIEMIAGNIRRFVADRRDHAAGLQMLCGSALAGMAFGLTGLGNVHCMARFVGAYFHVSHGLSNAICLPHVAAFNRASSSTKYARVARAMGVDADAPGEPEGQSCVVAIERICRDLGIPARLRDIDADPAKYEEMADLAIAAGYNRWNPRETTRDDFLKLFQEAH
jgi:alcohol dehydrogenase